MSTLSQLAQTVRAQLTSPGAPFEVIEQSVGSRKQKIFRNAFPSLPVLLDSARAHGDKPFMVFQGEHWSFDRFFAEVDSLAACLRSWGVGPGHRVAIAMRNRPEWAVAFVAIGLIGAVPAPLNSFGLREELTAALQDVEATVLICDKDRLDRLEGEALVKTCRVLCLDGLGAMEVDADYATVIAHAAPRTEIAKVEPDDPALILFTSGATSRAKAALSSQRAVCQALFNIDYIGAHAAMTSTDIVEAMMARGLPPTTLTAVPLFHVSGLHAQLLSALRNGRRLVFVYRWDPEHAIDLIAAEKITQFNGAPSMVAQLISQPAFDDPQRTGSLAGLGFGGAGLPQRLIDQVLDKKPDSMSGIGYGLTESNGMCAASSGRLFADKPRSAGMLSPIIEVKVVDAEGKALDHGQTGEICLRGVTLMDTYVGQDEGPALDEDGWFHTGDVGYVDETDCLFVVDRIKDVINRAGEKIAAAEVESCILQIPEVQEVAVVSVPDETTIEAVAAVVVPAPGAGLDIEAIQAHVGAHLAAYKVPSLVRIVQQPLPRNPAGKVLKGVVRDDLISGQS